MSEEVKLSPGEFKITVNCNCRVIERADNGWVLREFDWYEENSYTECKGVYEDAVRTRSESFQDLLYCGFYDLMQSKYHGGLVVKYVLQGRELMDAEEDEE